MITGIVAWLLGMVIGALLFFIKRSLEGRNPRV